MSNETSKQIDEQREQGAPPPEASDVSAAQRSEPQPPEPRADTRPDAPAQSIEGTPAPHEQVAYGAPAEEEVIRQPIALYYALIVGAFLTLLGLVSLVPAFTQGGVLFNIMQVSLPIAFLYLVTGLAGLGVAYLRQRRFATVYAAVIGAIYLITFSNGNVSYGNIETTFGLQDVLTRVQWITYNGLHAGLMLVSWLIAALSAMQKGDRATRAYRRERRWFLVSRSKTKV